MTRHKKHIKLRSMYQWHRYIGITIAVFVIMLATTGIMLNHTERFSLASNYIKSDWLLDYYGISAPQHVSSFSLQNHWVSQWEKQLYIDNIFVGEEKETLIGAVLLDSMIIMAYRNSLSAYTTDGQKIEQISSAQGLPGNIKAIGTDKKQQLLLDTNKGLYAGNSEFSVWQKTMAKNINWSKPQALPTNIYQHNLQQYRGRGLTLERIVLDLHSGRLLGQSSFYLMDFVALFMIFLGLSGLWLWGMRLLKSRKHKRH